MLVISKLTLESQYLGSFVLEEGSFLGKGFKVFPHFISRLASHRKDARKSVLVKSKAS